MNSLKLSFIKHYVLWGIASLLCMLHTAQVRCKKIYIENKTAQTYEIFTEYEGICQYFNEIKTLKSNKENSFAGDGDYCTVKAINVVVREAHLRNKRFPLEPGLDFLRLRLFESSNGEVHIIPWPLFDFSDIIVINHTSQPCKVTVYYEGLDPKDNISQTLCQKTSNAIRYDSFPGHFHNARLLSITAEVFESVVTRQIPLDKLHVEYFVIIKTYDGTIEILPFSYHVYRHTDYLILPHLDVDDIKEYVRRQNRVGNLWKLLKAYDEHPHLLKDAPFLLKELANSGSLESEVKLDLAILQLTYLYRKMSANSEEIDTKLHPQQ